MTALSPLQLEPLPGPRTVVVDYDKAMELVKFWKEQLSNHLAAVRAAVVHNDDDNSPLVLCDRISLSDKSYTAEAAQVIATFIKEPVFDDVPPLADGIIEVDLSDIIASRMTEEGLLVLRTLCDAFANSSKLVYVNLSHNAIGEQAIGSCETVLTKRSLERLSFDNSGLANETMATLADVLTREDEDGTGCVASNLTALHFSRNMSGYEGCKPFARIIEKCTKLQDLRFAANRPLGPGSDIVASVLDASLSEGHNPKLWKLDLHDNDFKSQASHDALFRALIAATSLTYLDLGGCELEDEGIKRVCHALFACRSPLEFLDLGGNGATRHGAKHIADYIRDCGGRLKTLRLEDNTELTSKGVVCIASAFHGSEDGHNIEEIQLNNCSIGAIGARALIDAFGPNGKDLPYLKKMFLNGNSFSEDVLSEIEVAFDYRLGELDDNDSDGDADDDLSDDEAEEGEEEEGEEEGGGGEPVGDSVDDLADAMENSLLV